MLRGVVFFNSLSECPQKVKHISSHCCYSLRYTELLVRPHFPFAICTDLISNYRSSIIETGFVCFKKGQFICPYFLRFIIQGLSVALHPHSSKTSLINREDNSSLSPYSPHNKWCLATAANSNINKAETSAPSGNLMKARPTEVSRFLDTSLVGGVFFSWPNWY